MGVEANYASKVKELKGAIYPAPLRQSELHVWKKNTRHIRITKGWNIFTHFLTYTIQHSFISPHSLNTRCSDVMTYDLWSPHSTPWTTDVIQLILTLKMTTAQVVETSVTVNNNRSIQDYVLPDDQTQPTFINLVKTILTSSRNLKMSYVTRPCWLYKANCKSFIPNWKNVVSSNKPRTMRLQGFMSIRSLAKQMQSSFNKS